MSAGAAVLSPPCYPAELDLDGIRHALLRPQPLLPLPLQPLASPPSAAAVAAAPCTSPVLQGRRDKSTLVLSLTKRLRSMKALLHSQTQHSPHLQPRTTAQDADAAAQPAGEEADECEECDEEEEDEGDKENEAAAAEPRTEAATKKGATPLPSKRAKAAAAPKAAPPLLSSASAPALPCADCPGHVSSIAELRVAVAGLTAALEAERASRAAEVEAVERRCAAVIQEKDDEVEEMRQLMDHLAAQQRPPLPAETVDEEGGEGEGEGGGVDGLAGEGEGTTALLSTSPASACPQSPPASSSERPPPAYPVLTPNSSPLLSPAKLQPRLNDTEELITFDARADRPCAASPTRHCAPSHTAALPPRSPYPTHPASLPLSGGRRAGGTVASTSSPFAVLSSPSSSCPPPSSPIAAAWQGYLERKGLQRERELQCLPITSPSTPDSKRRRIAEEDRGRQGGGGGQGRTPLSSAAAGQRPSTGPAPLAPTQLRFEEEKEPPFVAPPPLPTAGHRRAETTTALELRAGVRATAEEANGHRRSSAALRSSTASRAGEDCEADGGCGLSAADARRVSGELRKQRALLDVRNDWTVRVKAMNAIEELSREAGLARWADWGREVEALRPLLAEQLSDLRSSIVREACRLLVALCDSSRPVFEREVEFYFPLLFKGLYVTIRVIRDSCGACLQAVVQKMRSVRTVQALVAGCQDPHAIVREKVGAQLQGLLEAAVAGPALPSPAASVAELDGFAAELSGLCVRHMQDSDHGTRAAFRALFRAFSAAFGQRATAVYAELPGVVQRTLDKEMANHLGASSGTQKKKAGHRAH